MTLIKAKQIYLMFIILNLTLKDRKILAEILRV